MCSPVEDEHVPGSKSDDDEPHENERALQRGHDVERHLLTDERNPKRQRHGQPHEHVEQQVPPKALRAWNRIAVPFHPGNEWWLISKHCCPESASQTHQF